MSSAVQDFITEVLKRWPPPRTWGPEQEDAWSDDVIAEFSSEKEPIFVQALSVLKRQTRGYSGTPRIEDVIKAVNQAVREVGAQRRAGMLKLAPDETYDPFQPPQEHRAWTKDRLKLAYDLLPTEIGRQATREGWVKPYWEYIVTHGEAPKPHQYATLKSYAIDMDYCTKILRSGHFMAKQIVEAAQYRMLEAQRLGEIANGKRMPTKAEYFAEHFPGGFPAAPAKSSPPSKYADENLEEGRGHIGVTS